MASMPAEPVIITSRHTVLCAHEASWTALASPFRLGPLDQIVTAVIPIQVIFVYEQPRSTPDVELIPVERLKRALALLLDYYPHLTGRLHIDPTDGTPEITRLGIGAEIFVAKCSNRLDAFSSPTLGRILLSNLPGAGNALLAPFDPTFEAVCRDPILAVQHTRFACGGVALGVRALHKVCDALGFFQLVRDLAELYRGVRSSERIGDPASGVVALAQPPHIRSFMADLSFTPAERLEALEFKPSLLVLEPSVAATDPSASPAVTAAFTPVASTVVGRFLRFSSRELDTLKARATDASNSRSPDSWITTFEALSAHLYQVVHRARLQLHANDANQGELSAPNYLSPVNIRGRLLPPRYFPNALICTYTTFSSEFIANAPLWQVAQALHDLLRTPPTTSKEEMIRTLRWMHAQPDKARIMDSFEYGNGSFMVSQWNKFDLYPGTAFDVRPALVSPPFTRSSLFDGLVYYLPTEEQGTEGDAGAIDVSLSLYDALWRVIDEDEEFRLGGTRIDCQEHA